MSPDSQAIRHPRLFPLGLPIVVALLTAACGGSGSSGGAGGDGPPAFVSGSPTQASGLEQTVDMVFSNPSGADKILIVQMMIAPNLSAQKSCWIEYGLGEKSVRMMDGSGQGKAGEGAPLTNAQCTIDTAQLKHTVEGNSLKVSVPVRLEPGFIGSAQNIFALASAASQHSGWQTVGTWTLQPVAAK